LTATRSQAKRWLILLAKLCIVAVVAWGVHRAAGNAVHELQKHWKPSDLQFGWFVVAMALYLVGQVPSALFWYRVLWALGQRPGLGSALRAHFIGHLGKYVPGKAMVVVLRTTLIRGPKVDTGLAAACVFYETLTMMAVGAFMAAALLWFGFRQQTLEVLAGLKINEPLAILGALGLVAVTGLPVLPPVFRRVIRLLRIGKTDPRMPEKLAGLGYGTLATGIGFNVVGWLLLGLSQWAALRAGGFTSSLDFVTQVALCTAVSALAIVLGFVLQIPAGAGIREAVLLELLSPVYGADGALVAAILWRLVSLVAELLISVILYLLGLSSPKSPQVPSEQKST
jgi:uncharacterized membrane protein YbhN (UPF0104 family)